MVQIEVASELLRGEKQRGNSAPQRAPLAYRLDSGDGIQRIILARPQARNALSKQLVADFNYALDLASPTARDASSTQLALTESQKHNLGLVEGDCSTNEESPEQKVSVPPRCLIIQAEVGSPAFCAGADLVERSQMSEAEVVSFLRSLRSLFKRISMFPLPTIAAIDGPALGGGLEMALACDFRIAASSVSKLGLPEVRLGIIPCGGGTQRASRLLGMARAKDRIYTGRMIDAEQALDWGLIDYLAESKAGETAVSRAEQLAQSMSQGGEQPEVLASCLAVADVKTNATPSTSLHTAPLALMQAKLAITNGFDLGLESALDFEESCYATLLDTQDRREALVAFQQKRAPQFAGR